MPRKKADKDAKKLPSKDRFLYVQLTRVSPEPHDDDGSEGRTELTNGYCTDSPPYRSLWGRMQFLNSEQRKLVIDWASSHAQTGDMLSLTDDAFLIYLGTGPTDPIGYQLSEKTVKVHELQRMKRQ